MSKLDTPPATPRGSSRQVAYLAGPMRGYEEYNFPAFHAAAAKLRGHGLVVWSPAEHDVNEDGFDPAKDTAQPMRHYMKRDLPAVLNADMVCVLPGWEKSQGACLEVHVAQACGIPVYDAATMQPIAAPRSETAPTLADDLQAMGDAAYCSMIDEARKTDNLGWEQKVKDGAFGIKQLDSHVRRGELYGRHCAFVAASALAKKASASSATRRILPQEVKDFIADRSDIRDGSDGPLPNDWMVLQQMIEEAGL